MKKRKLKKKIFSWLIVLTLCFGMIPVNAFAADGEETVGQEAQAEMSEDSGNESDDTSSESGDSGDESDDTSGESEDSGNESDDTSGESGDSGDESDDTSGESGDSGNESDDTLGESEDLGNESGDTSGESGDSGEESNDTLGESETPSGSEDLSENSTPENVVPDEVPVDIPDQVQAFLDAVAAIPEITADNAKEAAEYIYGSVTEAYEALLGTEYEEREDVQEAVAAYNAAVAAVDGLLNLSVNVVPDEVQAFLDAVAAIPEITADNAVEVAEYVYGSVTEAYEALLGTEYEEREDVQEAVAVYAAAIEKLDAMLNMENEIFMEREPFLEDYAKGEGITKSAFENAYDLLEGDICCGTIVLDGEKNVMDYGTPNVLAQADGWSRVVNVTGYEGITIKIDNRDVATATWRYDGGKLFITFSPGKTGGTTKISVSVNALYPAADKTKSDKMKLNFDYIVTNEAGLDLDDGNSLFAPTEDWFVIDLNPDVENNAWRTDENGKILTYGNYNGYLYSHVTSYGYYVYPSRLYKVDKRLYQYPEEAGKNVADVNPKAVNTNWQEVQYTSKAKGIKFTVEGLSVGKADAVLVGSYDISNYGIYGYQWQHKIHITVIDTSKEATPNYTVIYTDGVDPKDVEKDADGKYKEDPEIFADQITRGLKEGDDTPAFAGKDADGNNLKGTEVSSHDYGTGKTVYEPKRSGYTFMGWKLITANPNKEDLQEKVVAEDANGRNTIIYEAQWKIVPPTYKVTYKWEGLPEKHTDPLPKVPVDTKEYEKDDTVTVDKEGKYTENNTREIDGVTYKFIGWSTKDATIKDGEFTMPGQDVTITGKWVVPVTPMDIKARYLVQWLDENGNALKTEEVRGPEAVGTKVEVTDDDKRDITMADGSTYTFITDSGKNILEGTLSKDAPVILKLYFRKTEKPVPTPTPGRTDPTPEPTPERRRNVEPTPEDPAPAEPVPEVFLPSVPVTYVPNPGVPLAKLPEELAEIKEGNVPLIKLPMGLTEIGDEEVPLADVPKTGDDFLIWGVIALLSGAGLVYLALDKKRRNSVK